MIKEDKDENEEISTSTLTSLLTSKFSNYSLAILFFKRFEFNIVKQLSFNLFNNEH